MITSEEFNDIEITHEEQLLMSEEICFVENDFGMDTIPLEHPNTAVEVIYNIFHPCLSISITTL